MNRKGRTDIAMTKIMYPFIDLAVHDAIRKPFADGTALAVVTTNFSDLIWANGPAARLFNHQTIYDFLDGKLIKKKKTKKKLRETAKQLLENRLIKNANLQILSRDDGSKLDLTLQIITMPKGEDAVLVIINGHERSSTGILDVEHIIAGFADTGTCVAVLGNQGQILGATDQFYALDVKLKHRRKLTEDVSKQKDRLVKRPLKTTKGALPSAIGHLSENPDIYLLFAIDEEAEVTVTSTPVEEETILLDDISSNDDLADAAILDEPSKDDLVSEEVEIIEELVDEADNISVEDEVSISDESSIEPLALSETTDEADFSDENDAADYDQEVVSDTPIIADNNLAGSFNFNPNQKAVRFIWRTDAAGIFTEISPELGLAIGPNAADVVGRRFADVAFVFNLNPSEEILELIRRRDTWSGKTVKWPVQGTDLTVPVDLAALPTYTRDRLFDGYRGFGIARLQEAVHDPQSIGFALSDGSYNDTIEAVEAAKAAPAQKIHNLNEYVDDEPAADQTEQTDIDDDPYMGEVPALDTSNTPKRRKGDKIVQLDELRREVRDRLTEDEQAAFLEIGKRLEQFGDKDDISRYEDDDYDASVTDIGPENQTSLDPIDELDGDAFGVAENEASETRASDMREDIEGTDSLADETPAPEDFENVRPFSRKSKMELNADTIADSSTPTLICAGDELIYANSAFFELTEYHDLEHIADLGGLDHLMNNLDEIGQDEYVLQGDDNNSTLRLADGSQQPVIAMMHSMKWRDRSALMMSFSPISIEVFEEETEEDTESETLKVKISDLSSILETATDGVVIIDHDSKIQSLNASASALFDYDADEIIGEPFAVLFASESQNAIIDYVGAMAGHGVASILNDGREVIGRVSSGGTLPLSMTMGRLSGSDGYCAVLRDISQSKHAEAELRTAKSQAESANAHKTDFLARVSHEIRTPLNAIIGFSDLISQERFGPVGHPRYIEYSHDIGKSGRHVLDIVNDLLDISKIEAGQQEMDFQSVSLNDEVTETLSLLQQIANENRVIVRSSLPTDVPAVVADKRSIKQILINILSNSIRFTPAGGQIVVSCSLEPQGNVLLRIRDNGVGMSRAELDRAMQPFGQVGQETRQRGEGTGLGLPLTRAMTEANRAKFDIVSAPGEGTLVTINFPPQRVLTD